MSLPLSERVAKSSIPEPNSGCFLWFGAVVGRGYGHLAVDGKYKLAHRVAWELVHGPVADGLCVLHRCDNPACVNVRHLFVGTLFDNNRDRSLKGRTYNGRKARTHCPQGHPYDATNTYERGGWRQCKICRAFRNRERDQRGRRAKRSVA